MRRVNGTGFVLGQIVAAGQGVIPGTDYVAGETFELAAAGFPHGYLLVVTAGEPDEVKSQTPVTVLASRR